MSAPDVSIVVFARDEGFHLHACVQSVMRAVKSWERDGRSAELILLLHQPSQGTSEWAGSFASPPWRLVRLDDPRRGAARRHAAELTSGRFTSFIDASDAWSKNWLAAALWAAEKATEPAVWHPELVLQCGNSYSADQGYAAALQTELVSADARLGALHENPFAPGFLTSAEILSAVPFPEIDEARGWTACDWWWTCNTLAHGCSHRIVPRTALYRRAVAVDPSEAIGTYGPTHLAGAIGWTP